MSKHMYSTANLTDVELKDQGNRMFSARKYDDAINLYTKAIVSDFFRLSLLFTKIPFCLSGGLFDVCIIILLCSNTPLQSPLKSLYRHQQDNDWTINYDRDDLFIFYALVTILVYYFV